MPELSILLWGKKTREFNKAWKPSSIKVLVSDILRSLGAWPVAIYLLVPCAACLTLLMAQAAFSRAATEGPVSTWHRTEPLLTGDATSIICLRCKLL